MPRLGATKFKPERRAPLEVDRLVAAVAREQREPMSAYDLVDILARRGQRVAPQQVYRSLGRLRSEGVVRRIESLNAYCAGSEDGRAVLFCEVCGSHELLPVSHLAGGLGELAQSRGYALSRTVIELCGRCETCAPAAQIDEDQE